MPFWKKKMTRSAQIRFICNPTYFELSYFKQPLPWRLMSFLSFSRQLNSASTPITIANLEVLSRTRFSCQRMDNITRIHWNLK